MSKVRVRNHSGTPTTTHLILGQHRPVCVVVLLHGHIVVALWGLRRRQFAQVMRLCRRMEGGLLLPCHRR